MIASMDSAFPIRARGLLFEGTVFVLKLMRSLYPKVVAHYLGSERHRRVCACTASAYKDDSPDLWFLVGCKIGEPGVRIFAVSFLIQAAGILSVFDRTGLSRELPSATVQPDIGAV